MIFYIWKGKKWRVDSKYYYSGVGGGGLKRGPWGYTVEGKDEKEEKEAIRNPDEK